MADKKDQQYSEQEAQQRFEAALRGAKTAGHKTMKSMARKTRQAGPKARIRPIKNA